MISSPSQIHFTLSFHLCILVHLIQKDNFKFTIPHDHHNLIQKMIQKLELI